MGVVIADRAVDLAEQGDLGDARPLRPQAMDDVGHLLAERGRRRGLAVGARQHRLIGMAMGEVADGGDGLVHQGQQHLIAPGLDHEAVGEVVDVFRGAGEVDELPDLGEFGVARDPLLQEVLDRLDVVVGGALDLLDALGVREAEVVCDRIEQTVRGVRERRHLRDRRVS